jgi:hypothetical protein
MLVLLAVPLCAAQIYRPTHSRLGFSLGNASASLLRFALERIGLVSGNSPERDGVLHGTQRKRLTNGAVMVIVATVIEVVVGPDFPARFRSMYASTH